jgi:AcrR family transcriptional regulator
MSRYSKYDWLDEGLRVLADEGVSSLTIDTLAIRLNITKGSFYHHFKNQAHFITELLQHFENAGTLQLIEYAEIGATPIEKFQRLIEIILRSPNRVEIVIRAWARVDAQVQTLQAKIDAQRLAYVQALLMGIGFVPAQAALMTQLLYTMLIGSEQIYATVETNRLAALFTEFRRLYRIEFYEGEFNDDNRLS